MSISWAVPDVYQESTQIIKNQDNALFGYVCKVQQVLISSCHSHSGPFIVLNEFSYLSEIAISSSFSSRGVQKNKIFEFELAHSIFPLE